jgi:hypothetical protein
MTEALYKKGPIPCVIASFGTFEKKIALDKIARSAVKPLVAAILVMGY